MKSEAGGKKIKRSPPSAKIIKNMTVESDLPEGAEIVGLAQTFVSLFKKDIQEKFLPKFKKKDDG